MTFVGLYSFTDHGFRIVGSLHQFAAVSITNARLNWRTVDQTVDVAAQFLQILRYANLRISNSGFTTMFNTMVDLDL